MPSGPPSKPRGTRSTTSGARSRPSKRPPGGATWRSRRRLRQMLADLDVALEQDAGQKLGGKSAEAARFIARAIIHELDAQAAAA